jgi:DNA topoisomerase VI subunit B
MAEKKVSKTDVTVAKTPEVKAEVKEAAKEVSKKVEAVAEKTAEVVETKAKEAAKTTAKKAETVKKAVKKAAPKKKEEAKTSVVVQVLNQEFDLSDLEEKVKAQFVADGHRAGCIKLLNIYAKPEEGKAYYVVNDGKFTGSVNL